MVTSSHRAGIVWGRGFLTSVLAAGLCLFLADVARAHDFVPGQLLVKFKPNHARRALTLLHAQVLHHLLSTGVDQVQLPTGISVEKGLARLRANPDVAYAEPNYRVRLLDVDDPLFPQQWALRKINAVAAWGITTGSPGVLVAVLDSGADLGHPDLVGKIADSRNFVSFGSATDGNGHGSHTAGTIAAVTDNAIGVASLGYRTRLLIGKVVSDTGQGDVASLAQGVDWATSDGAKVISISLAFNVFSQTMKDSVDNAWAHGVVIVAAAGNNGNSTLLYPAAYDHCIAVAATDENDIRCSFSNYGSWVHVAAPGNHILSLYKRGGTATLSGTSMAAPHVAALAALLWSHGGRSNALIRMAIEDSGDPALGFGPFPVLRINARRALLRFP